jgi:hypothetical protein
LPKRKTAGASWRLVRRRRERRATLDVDRLPLTPTG